MKKFFFLFIFISTNVFSQTTLEEWNYITKGYKIQKESGLDMKKGYELKDILTSYYNYDTPDRVFNFKQLIRLRDNQIAAIMIEVVLSSNGQKYTLYYCIPQWNTTPEIQNLFLKEIRNINNKDFLTAYSWALSQLISRNYINKN